MTEWFYKYTIKVEAKLEISSGLAKNKIHFIFCLNLRNYGRKVVYADLIYVN